MAPDTKAEAARSPLEYLRVDFVKGLLEPSGIITGGPLEPVAMILGMPP
jgi:hypothetical protein